MTMLNEGWLEEFFAPPNGLAWSTISDGAEPADVAEVLRPWLALLGEADGKAPLVLPFVRDGGVTGWYAVAQRADRSDELRDLLMAWFGLTWFSRFEITSSSMADPLAAILRSAFGATVFRFTGGGPEQNRRISDGLVTMAGVLSRKPATDALVKRPIGTVRAEFDRALLLRDETNATALLEELRDAGRLSDENLRYLEVRFRAGLGLWREIAHDHWLIKNLSDLALPPQIVADLIEALYRMHLDAVEKTEDPDALKAAFVEHLGGRYPRLFASRRGVRTERVVKAFILYEQCQDTPNALILGELADLLSPVERLKPPFDAIIALPSAVEDPVDLLSVAEAAFNDHQLDRAFVLFLECPPTSRSLARAVMCAVLIDTPEITDKLASAIRGAGSLFEALPSKIRASYEALSDRHHQPIINSAAASETAATVRATDWLTWAHGLQLGDRTPPPADAAITWETSSILGDINAANNFADAIGFLTSDFQLARQVVPIIYAAFVNDLSMGSSARPIAINLCMIIGMDESLSKVDLALLYQLTVDLTSSSMTTQEYLSLIEIVSEVQERVASYVHLAWALDMAEALAVTSTPSETARAARDQFFNLVIRKAQGFAHRLRHDERQSFITLSQDYAVDFNALGLVAKVDETSEEQKLPSLNGKTIGIYTLVEAAGARAKSELEAIFPGVTVVLNGDTVATEKLTNLAANADYFVFAWRSSSHAAYYCIKDAMGGRDLILPQGKGTASILRAVIDSVK
ncbi:protein DpdD [Agrobacterium sp. fls2-241-TYG-188a]|uniref:protein DpdD n=1 Tax=Agrobacterium sp. fls2-241-TYG-188a TaxID=3040275 RepID=UPI00254C4CD0|nr:protein DpdD [Agrobacterium sp. fls2-241-TYG-188a]